MTSEGNGNGMVMPVAPFYGGGYGGNNGGDFGGNGAWWLLILLIALGGWGNNGFGGGMGGGGGMFPWLVNGQMNGVSDVQRGFDQNSVMTGLNGIQNTVTNGFTNVQTALCNGFAGVSNGFAQAEIANNARQIADMQQNFAAQTAMMQGFNGLQGQFANCCCENRTTSLQNTRDIIDSQTRGTQLILDKLCALELDGVKGQLAAAQRENVGLQNQLNMANLAASQTAQTVNIRDSIIDELRSCPIPSQPVYGSQPIFSCPNNNNGGCGCGNGF